MISLHTWDMRLSKAFWDRVVEVPGSCWLWVGGLNATGYGVWPRPSTKKTGLAHRVAYETLVAPIAKGLHLDHLCHVPRCVNPAHLEPVTPRENSMRGFGPSADNARKTHCKRGHEFTQENTYIFRHRNGLGRACKACRPVHYARRLRKAWQVAGHQPATKP